MPEKLPNLSEQIKSPEGEFVDEHEHIVDIESPEVQEKIQESRELFKSFFEKYGEDFDLSNSKKRQKVFEAAEKEGIYDKAKEIRELIYGKNISVYGVCYISNKCDQNCKFCPMGQVSYKKWQDELALAENELMLQKGEARGYKREEFVEIFVEEILKEDIADAKSRFKTLTPEEAEKDMNAIVEVGHQEICVLAGEEISFNPILVVEYAQIALNRPGVKEVILNMGSYNERVFKFIRDSLNIPEGVTLQHRVFQETYDRDEYDYYMERSGPKESKGKISKRDYNYRYESQVAALEAGFDEVGIGALFGLTRHPMKEIAGLQEHADYIKEKTGKEPKRCCLPFANNPEEDHPVDIKHMVPGMEDEKKIIELTYALARLAMPTVSIVSSERDNLETLRILDQYANHTTLFVHPAPGENVASLQELKKQKESNNIRPVGQAEVFSRIPEDALTDWRKRGYSVFGFNVEKYQD